MPAAPGGWPYAPRRTGSRASPWSQGTTPARPPPPPEARGRPNRQVAWRSRTSPRPCCRCPSRPCRGGCP
eukprot:13629554-Alexandrium_andersonii.AAC.1